MKIAILLTVFNRRETTLDCLRACYTQIESLKVESAYDFSVYLTDDGSTDGTSEAVRENFPEVNIIRGDGKLYWNRGMIAAWEEAAKSDFDAYIWLNDDTILHTGAFATILENSVYLKHKAIIVGTAVDSEGKYSYGGRRMSGEIIPPDPIIPLACDIFNGNLVFVPKSVFKILGTMDPIYSHGFGDFDYGVRALKAGLIAVVSPEVLASCNRNGGVPKWRDGSHTLKQRYEALMKPNGRPLREQFVFDTRKSNVFYALLHCLSLNLKVLFPKRK